MRGFRKYLCALSAPLPCGLSESFVAFTFNPPYGDNYAHCATTAATCANVSLALAKTVANMLLYGADHLSKGNIVLPPDDTSSNEDSDEDAVAL
jgi:hypothetical protein